MLPKSMFDIVTDRLVSGLQWSCAGLVLSTSNASATQAMHKAVGALKLLPDELHPNTVFVSSLALQIPPFSLDESKP